MKKKFVPYKGNPAEWGVYRKDFPWSKFVLLSRERHKRDLQRSLDDPSYPYYYDQVAADKAVWFISNLKHFEGEWFGQYFLLSDWQEFDIIRVIFGWKRKDNGYRRFRTAYIEIARRNGKSFLAAAIGLYMAIADNEPGAQVYCAATKEQQARIVWEGARRMIAQCPDMREHTKSFKSAIVFQPLGSKFLPLGSDSDKQDGFSVHAAIIDEYHAHKTSEMFDVLSSGRGSRRQPLLFVITTAGFGSSTPCRKESDYAKKVLEGIIENEEYFAFIATVDNAEDWKNPDEWIKANPNWGISVYEEGFQSEFNEAEQSPAKQNGFKTKRLNLWCEQATRWINVSKWDTCGGEIDLDLLKGRRCWCGLDLGITRDLSAFCAAFMVPVPGKDQPDVYLLMKYWCCEEGLHRRYHDDGVPYPLWAGQGWITTTPGDSTRYDIIRQSIAAFAEEYEIAEIAIDRAHAHQLMVELADDGHTIVKHAQTCMAMNFPCRSLEELMLNGQLKHGGDPVLRWMASNVAILTDGNENMKIIKDKSGDRVDGIVAAVMAVGRLLIAPQDDVFIYNKRAGLYVA